MRRLKPDGIVVEHFLTMIDNTGHSGEKLYKAVVSTLDFYKIGMADVRGQSYDNASSMKGKYKGLESRIKERNPQADY